MNVLAAVKSRVNEEEGALVIRSKQLVSNSPSLTLKGNDVKQIHLVVYLDVTLDCKSNN